MDDVLLISLSSHIGGVRAFFVLHVNTLTYAHISSTSIPFGVRTPESFSLAAVNSPMVNIIYSDRTNGAWSFERNYIVASQSKREVVVYIDAILIPERAPG